MNSPSVLLLVFDLLGVFAFAVSGNLLAARRNFDITGGLILGVLAGLGGGIIRDVILVAVPTSLREPIYLVPPVLAAVMVYLLGHRAERARVPIVVFDAIGLALFSVTGSIIAVAAGMNLPTAVILGVVTATGGGLLRDVVANEVPAIFSGSDIYVIPAFFGALTAALVRFNELWNVWTGTAIVVLVFVFRMVAWRLQWRVPAPMRGWSFRAIHAQARKRGSAFRPLWVRRGPARVSGSHAAGTRAPDEGAAESDPASASGAWPASEGEPGTMPEETPGDAPRSGEGPGSHPPDGGSGR
ncbi:TRIC cation channel family protein [Brevibacterium ihuae]|uniref:TRIC cation channel family protein n=1 Tax=Brevibacterium ihuae TaxID=1631743 RepID=UPI000C77B17F